MEAAIALEITSVLRAAFPGQDARHFLPMTIGRTPASADEGAALILNGTKTATSSPFWDYPDGRIPFVGALSVLLDGSQMPRGIVETTRVDIIRFGSVDAELAYAYGEGPRTLEWWARVMGDYYRASAAQRGAVFTDNTEIICEWIAVVKRL